MKKKSFMQWSLCVQVRICSIMLMTVMQDNSPNTGTKGTLKWQDNWVPLLDTLLQFSLLGAKQRALMLPTRIRKVTVDPSTFLTHLQETGDAKTTSVSETFSQMKLIFQVVFAKLCQSSE